MNISTIYSKEAVTVVKDAPLKSATHLMKDVFVSDVIVVEELNPEGELPVGILTDKDIVMNIIAANKDIDQLKVKEAMKTDIITVSSHADIIDCLNLMAEKKTTRMPVVNEQGCVIGMISISDILGVLNQLFKAMTDVIKLK